MTNTIKCPHCGKVVEITTAFKHQIEEELLSAIETRHKKEMEEAILVAQEKAVAKAKEMMDMQIKDSKNETEELRNQNKKLSEQLLETNKLIREIKMQSEEQKLEMEKRLQKELDLIREDTMKKSDEHHHLKDLEKEKKIADMEKLIEELKRKAQQGSMQTQGEVLELDLENILRNTFPSDEIIPVEKGVRGADIKQVVRSIKGHICGVILWESKHTKVWSDEWIAKLKDDLRSEKAHIPVIVSVVLPKEIAAGFGIKNGVYICNYQLLLPLAEILRQKLIEVAREKFFAINRESKAETIYSYITSHEFIQTVEVLIETYHDMQLQIQKERLAFEKIWKMREVQINKILINVSGIYGNLRGRAGSTLPTVKGLELLEGESDLQSGNT